MRRTDDITPQTFARACALVRGRQWLATIERDMTASTGRPRTHSWETFFIVLQIAAIEGFGDLVLAEAARVSARLSARQREALGLSAATLMEYQHLESMLGDLHFAMQETVDTETGEVRPPRLSLSLPDLMSHIACGFIPDSIPATDTQSIDSTDYECHYRRRSWKSHMTPDIPVESLPEEDFTPTKTEVNDPGWPLTGHDGRLQHTVDPDARDGYRAGKNKSRKDVFVGWDLHTSVDTPALGADAVPPLIRAICLVPGGSKKAAPGLAVVDALTALGTKPTTVLVDRGYTFLSATDWARPLDERGVAQVFDLHTTQRGQHPGPISGTFYLDGALFIDALPETLRDLPAHSLGQTTEQKARLAARYDERVPYAFSTQGKPDHKRGTQRYRGPALAGRVRCPNTPRSMRLSPSTRPTTTCTLGQPCACGTTVTLGPEDHFQTRQRDLYGTTAWKAAYGRRSAVESGNANLKTHHAKLQRHSTRVKGTNRNGILVALIVASANASLLLSRYGYDVGNPPTDDAPIAPLPSPRTALHRTRAFKRRQRKGKSPPNAPPGKPGHPPTKWASPIPTPSNTI